MVDVPFESFWKILGRLVIYFMGRKAHTEIVLVIQDGSLQRVRVNQSFLPADIPKV